MDAVKYLVGLVIFSSIGSFLIVDATAFVRVVGKINNRLLFLDFLRLVVLAGMAAIGFMLAKETFIKPDDWIKFLVIGAIASFVLYALGIKRRKTETKKIRR
jgi:Mn2+/Fe2+ NRAMP family transporter